MRKYLALIVFSSLVGNLTLADWPGANDPNPKVRAPKGELYTIPYIEARGRMRVTMWEAAENLADEVIAVLDQARFDFLSGKITEVEAAQMAKTKMEEAAAKIINESKTLPYRRFLIDTFSKWTSRALFLITTIIQIPFGVSNWFWGVPVLLLFFWKEFVRPFVSFFYQKVIEKEFREAFVKALAKRGFVIRPDYIKSKEDAENKITLAMCKDQLMTFRTGPLFLGAP